MTQRAQKALKRLRLQGISVPNAECIAKEANLEAIEAQEHALRKYVKTGLKPLALDDVKRYSDAFDSIVQEGMDADNKD